jgi:hypothetical protein
MSDCFWIYGWQPQQKWKKYGVDGVDTPWSVYLYSSLRTVQVKMQVQVKAKAAAALNLCRIPGCQDCFAPTSLLGTRGRCSLSYWRGRNSNPFRLTAPPRKAAVNIRQGIIEASERTKFYLSDVAFSNSSRKEIGGYMYLRRGQAQVILTVSLPCPRHLQCLSDCSQQHMRLLTAISKSF